MAAKKLPLTISFLVLFIFFACYFCIPSFNSSIREAFNVLISGDKQLIRDWVSQFGIWGPLVIILAMVASMFLFVVPNLLLLIISSVSYGPLWGSLISAIAVFVSSTVAYLIGYWVGPALLRRVLSEKTRTKLTQLVKDYGIGAIILFRLSPILSNEAISFIPAFLRMNYTKFIVATLIGSAPVITILAFTTGEGNGNLKTVLIWLSVISLIAYIIYLVIDVRRKKRRRLRASSNS